MKLLSNDVKKNTKLLLVLLMIVVWLLAEACSMQELSRSRAQSLITQTQDFKNVTAISLISVDLLRDMRRGEIAVESIDEPVETVIERRKTVYYHTYPIAGIAAHLGLVNAQINRRDERIDVWSGRPLGFWQTDENYVLTDKAKKLWADYDEAAQETVIPTAKKEFIEVTGITSLGPNDARVEFTYKWLPNTFGRALDPSTAEFRELPADLQNSLKETKDPYGGTYEAGWGNARRGFATFKKYDDGWRILNVAFS